MSPEEISKSALETVINSFQEAAFIVDSEGIILFANEVFAKRMRKKVNEIINTCVYQLFPPDVANRRKSHIEQVIKTKTTTSFEDEREGRHYIAYMTPISDQKGNIGKVLIIAYDITEKKKLEEELKNSHEQLMSILNSIDNIIYISDIDTYEIIFTNAHAKRVFGEDIDGKTCYEVFNKSLKPCEHCPIEFLKENKEKVYRWEQYNSNKKRYYAVTSRLIKWTDGRDVKFSMGIDITDNKIADIKLKENEEKFRGILENLNEGFFRTTPEGRYLMANLSLARLYGYTSPEELIEDTKDIASQRFYNKEDRKRFIQLLETYGHVENFESLRLKKDGSTFWGIANARAVKGEDGNTLYYEGTTIDITERKLMEERLSKEREKLLILIENAPFGMALIDSHEKYIYINPKFHEVFGYDLTDIPDRDTWFNKAYPDEADRNKVMSLWKEEIERFQVGESTSKIFTVTCKDGSKKKVEIIPVILETGLFLMTYIDITEKEKIEKSYRTIFETAIEGICQTTLDGRFIVANPALIRMLGYDSFEDLSENVKAPQTHVDPSERERMIDILKSGKEIKGYGAQLYRKDGTKIYVSISMSPVYDDKGNIIYIQSIVEDMTEKKRGEEEILTLRQQYAHAQKMEALGTLTGGIAHDFNNFITAIMGYATLLSMKTNKDAQLKRYADQIIAVSNRMTELVKNLLAFSRKQPINMAPMELNNEVKEIKKMIKRLLTENIDFKVVTSDKNLVINGDKTQFSQILFNMATNARDAMPNGGEFVIKIDTITIDEDFIRAHGFGKKGDYALVVISDTGTGIEKDIINKIFDPFFTTKEQGKGTGLGLASAYGIIKQHNGYITVDSTPGKGTTFYIYLPLINLEVKEEIKEETIIQKKSGTILIGEDEEDVRGFFKGCPGTLWLYSI
ncbi:MAG TPA: PAS domain S-box protein [Syntrophorhabdaceae bacterium]|nr:PAS domain S-box protein [Syntrophorhabdaceae bacterium]